MNPMKLHCAADMGIFDSFRFFEGLAATQVARSASLRTGLGNCLDQFGGSNGEGMGQLDDVDEARVPLAAFNPAHVVPVKVGQLC